jgi:hypothetical protein
LLWYSKREVSNHAKNSGTHIKRKNENIIGIQGGRYMSGHKPQLNIKIPEVQIPEEYFITGIGGSSKGYAKKAFYQGKCYKVSAGTFNAQAEVLASRLAEYTSLPSYINYSMCKINGEWGTVSDDFIKGRNHETVKSLHAKLLVSPIEDIESRLSGEALFRYVQKFVLDNLKLDITEGLNLMLRFDSIILNEDRHFRNIEFIENENGLWEMAPPFDFDCSFFSQVEDWGEIASYARKSQPFFQTHTEQIEFMKTVSDKKLILKPFMPEKLAEGIWSFDYQLGKAEVLEYLQTIKGGLVI